MTRVEYEVRPMGDGRWEVSGGDSVATFDDKHDAIDHARESAIAVPGGVVLIRDEYGSIEAEHDYGRDRPETES